MRLPGLCGMADGLTKRVDVHSATQNLRQRGDARHICRRPLAKRSRSKVPLTKSLHRHRSSRLGLQNFIEPAAYCESDSFALSLLEARVAEGTLPQGPIWRDVHTLTRREWPAHLAAPNGIVAGWPCQDLSKAGKMRGMSAPRSGLWREVMRIADEFRSDFLLLENVDQLRFCLESWRPLLDAFAERSFNVRWVSLAAQNAGSPQDRRRIFIFATREGHEVQGFLACSSAQSFSGPGTGLLFNSGRPHPRDWLLPRAEHKLFRARLCALANAVVPQQAALAFRLLLSQNAE